MTAYHQTMQRTQMQPAAGRASEMIKNDAGGYTFAVSPEQYLRRFLIIGTEGGTYYTNQKDHTLRVTVGLEATLKNLGPRAVKQIVEVSEGGLAPKVSPQLFALAMAMSSPDVRTRSVAAEAFPKVVRTGSHLLEIVSYMKPMRGGGRLFRETIGNWYLEQTDTRLAYQMAKYGSRFGFTQRDVLRLARPKPINQAQSDVFAWACNRVTTPEYPQYSELPSVLWAVDELRRLTGESVHSDTMFRIRELIEKFRLPWEVVPSELLAYPEIWDAIEQPLTARIRNLGRLTSIGYYDSREHRSETIRALTDSEYLKRSRVHPMSILLALKVYKNGAGVLGKKSWTPDKDILNALDQAFYASFANVEPTGKRFFLGMDVSGSMNSPAGGTPVTNAEAAMAMAMVTMETEKNVELWGFSNRLVDLRVLGVSPRNRMEDNLRIVNRVNFGATDCSAPMVFARNQRIPVDVFAIYTDNETWAGRTHPHKELVDYRRTMGIQSRSIVSAFTASANTIADPKDPLTLDTVGLDASLPTVISNFAMGRF